MPTPEAKIQELEIHIAKQESEQAALEALFFEFVNQLNQDESKWFQRLQVLKSQKWDSFLLFVERTRPELAAAIDRRSISEIPTDSEAA